MKLKILAMALGSMLLISACGEPSTAEAQNGGRGEENQAEVQEAPWYEGKMYEVPYTTAAGDHVLCLYFDQGAGLFSCFTTDAQGRIKAPAPMPPQ